MTTPSCRRRFAWSALKLLSSLDQAFDELYLDGVDMSLLEQVRNGFVVVVGITLAIGLVVALSFLALEFPLVDVLGSLLLIAILGEAGLEPG